MANNLTIGITGASGHIGSALTNYLNDQGYRVVAFTRNIDSLKNVVARKYDLNESIPDNLFSDIDVLIHCAYVNSKQSAEAEVINYNGSKYLFDSCRKQGVKKIIFFSSVTSHRHAKSGYAKSKYAIEQLLNNDRDFIIHCSLVVGTGGLFQQMLSYTITHTFVPVIGRGTQIIQIAAIDDVVRFVEIVIQRGLVGFGVLASEEVLTYKQFFSCIAHVYRKQIFFIPVPVFVLTLTLRMCKFLNIRTRASQENILGIRMLVKRDPLLLLTSYKTFRSKLEELRKLDSISG